MLYGFLSYALFPGRSHYSEGSPVSLAPLLLINLIPAAIPLLFTFLISRGLFKLSNKIRLQMLMCNKIAIVLLLIIAIPYVLVLPVVNNYKVLAIGLFGVLIVFYLPAHIVLLAQK